MNGRRDGPDTGKWTPRETTMTIENNRPTSWHDASAGLFREGPIDGVVFKRLTHHEVARGGLVELFRHDELEPSHYPVMAYVSRTLPGVARGPHEHRWQTDCFAFVGPGEFKLYLWDARQNSPSYAHKQTAVVGQSNRQRVVIPPGVVHAYQNISGVEGLVINSPNRLYAGDGKREPVDEIRHEGKPDTLYLLD